MFIQYCNQMFYYMLSDVGEKISYCSGWMFVPACSSLFQLAGFKFPPFLLGGHVFPGGLEDLFLVSKKMSHGPCTHLAQGPAECKMSPSSHSGSESSLLEFF